MDEQKNYRYDDRYGIQFKLISNEGVRVLFVQFLISVLKKLTFMLLSVLLFISTISFSTNLKKMEEAKRKLDSLSKVTFDFVHVVKIDGQRMAVIEKIDSIMNRYNRNLSSQQRYLIANEIYNMSIKYDNLDVDLICATITHESGKTWRPDIISRAGAMGLMQIMPYTGSYLSNPEGIKWTNAQEILFNPIYNIRMGCRYLSMLIELYHVDGGLAAYNGGEIRAARWLASGRNNEVLFEETRGYVPAVLKLYDTYKN